MGWSTRQLAELAGTTVKTIRHYHEVGLLDEPERASNGYKQYGTEHLVRLLQIIRMKDLGIPLAQIRTMGRADEDPEEAIRILDADLAATIERLQRVRAELAIVLKFRAPIDTPAPFQAVADKLSERDRSFVTVLSRVYETSALNDLSDLIGEESELDALFDALTEEADSAAIEHVARALAVDMATHRDRFPWMADPNAGHAKDRSFTQMALGTAVSELLNTAQLTAIARAVSIAESARPSDADDIDAGAADADVTEGQ